MMVPGRIISPSSDRAHCNGLHKYGNPYVELTFSLRQSEVRTSATIPQGAVCNLTTRFRNTATF
jgi:hypothetical protein